MTRHPSFKHLVTIAVLTALGFFLLGYGSIVLWNGDTNSSSPVWPATAFAFCLALRMGHTRRECGAVLAAMVLAGLCANGLAGMPPVLNVGFSIINMLDVLAGLIAVRRLRPIRLRNLPSALRFSFAAAISPSLVGALLSGLLVSWHGGDGQVAGLQWFFANILGVCIVFPLGMTVSTRQIAKLRLAHRLPEALGVAFGVIMISLLAFHFPGHSLQFLALASVIIAGARFRLLGAGAALIVVATIALVSPPHNVLRIETLQLFLAVCSLLSVRTALVLNERDMHIAVIERRRRRASRASRFKTQLLSHVSHEVRSPLSAIIGFSAMLESGALSADRAPEFARIIAHNGELLQRLHDDLLDLSRAEAGALALAPARVPVAETLHACVEGIRLDTALGGKQVLVDPIGAELAVTADPLRLAQIVNNLISNAYKYGDNSSPIRVRARQTLDGFGRIEIVNTGPGIPEQEHDAVFRPYMRSQSVGRSVPGAGLGLSIAKLLVEMQGGRIDFESIPGRHTCFWVDLPLAA